MQFCAKPKEGHSRLNRQGEDVVFERTMTAQNSWSREINVVPRSACAAFPGVQAQHLLKNARCQLYVGYQADVQLLMSQCRGTTVPTYNCSDPAPTWATDTLSKNLQKKNGPELLSSLYTKLRTQTAF